ncbi:hypothetical protein L9F63_006465, partial [Diploptera punctata]
MATQTKVPDNNVAYYHTYEYKALQELKRHGKMHGARRVIMFCLLTAVLPTILLVIPLYLRHSVYADVTYEVAESDVLEIDDGISTVFCQEHSLRMNSSFHAFQMKGTPELSPNRKHIRLKKSMILPDDTLEYWGFYLLKGSSISLFTYHKFEGSRVMVVKGERNLRTCGLLEHKKEGPVQSQMAPGKVRVTFETNAQEIKPIKVLQSSTTEKPIDEQFEGENLSNENFDFNNLTVLEQFAEEYVKKHYKTDLSAENDTSVLINNTKLENQSIRHLRHAKSRLHEFETRVADFKKGQNDNKQQIKRRKKNLKRRNKKNGSMGASTNVNNSRVTDDVENDVLNGKHIRSRRNVHIGRTHRLDGGVEHGGNANNVTNTDNDPESSFSSFENSLRTCYQGQILMNEEFPPSSNCTDIHALEIHGTMEAVHDNDIHAIFNIHKSTYQYAEHSRSCNNETECTFPITFWSDEIVIVEIPTRDGIERDGIERASDDITLLISSCHPRMTVYIIFPVAVLFLILGCAF